MRTKILGFPILALFWPGWGKLNRGTAESESFYGVIPSGASVYISDPLQLREVEEPAPSAAGGPAVAHEEGSGGSSDSRSLDSAAKTAASLGMTTRKENR